MSTVAPRVGEAASPRGPRHVRAAEPARPRPRYADPLSLAEPVLQRCACGGGCPACRAKAAGLPALPIHPADDVYEREADRVADAVVRGGSAPARTTAPALPSISRLQRCSCGGSGALCPECAAKKEEEMQRSASGEGGAGVAPPIVHEVLRASGEPLDPASRAFFEPRFGRGFGDVRVHTDSRAAESARAVDAVAYTVGRNLVFGAGAYRPESAAGRRLLAHELTHVVQQGGAGAAVQRFQFADNCGGGMRSRITDGHRLAENATANAAQVLASEPQDVAKVLFDYYFGAKSNTPAQRGTIVANYNTLNSALKEDFTYRCPPDGEDPCKGAHAQVLDRGNVVVCTGTTAGFSRQGMARLMVHETVRRAHGKLSVSNHNDAAGECKLAPYGDAGTDANHPIPYSCFASTLIGRQLAEGKVKADALFQHLWPGRDHTSYWTGTLAFDNGTPPVAVSVTLTTMLSDLDFIVTGSYSYIHPQGGATTGSIPFGQVRQAAAPGQPERVNVSFEWVEGASTGKGYWSSTGAGEMDGRWGRKNSSSDGGRWTVHV